MKRMVLEFKRMNEVSGCCPGHDVFPNETYSNRRSKAARSRDIAKEHRYSRRKARQHYLKEEE